MEVQLSTTIFCFLSTAFLLSSTTAGQLCPPPSNEIDYVRTSCETTLHPETCFASLSNYSGVIQHDPYRLALVAIQVALSNTTVMANYLANVSCQVSGNTTESAAVYDCLSVFTDAVDEIKNSQSEMKLLGCSGESVSFQLSNVQTWMSAALTDEETCIDGFELVEDGDVKVDIWSRVAAVKEVTSNALALVNSYADTILGQKCLIMKKNIDDSKFRI